MKKPLLFTCLLLVGMHTNASKAQESIYQRRYCEGMELEKHLPSGGRVDCLSPVYAIEVEWAQHWAEDVGQSLYYAGATNRKPGIILLCEQSEGPVEGCVAVLSDSRSQAEAASPWRAAERHPLRSRSRRARQGHDRCCRVHRVRFDVPTRSVA